MRASPIAAALMVCTALAGCVASNSGVVPGYDGSLTISQRGLAGTQPQTLTARATQEATAHCHAGGKRFRRVDLKESPPGMLAPQAESELKFVCE